MMMPCLQYDMLRMNPPVSSLTTKILSFLNKVSQPSQKPLRHSAQALDDIAFHTHMKYKNVL